MKLKKTDVTYEMVKSRRVTRGAYDDLLEAFMEEVENGESIMEVDLEGKKSENVCAGINSRARLRKLPVAAMSADKRVFLVTVEVPE